jgi:hypothetical protein
MIGAAEACDLKRYSAVVVGIFCYVSPATLHSYDSGPHIYLLVT